MVERRQSWGPVLFSYAAYGMQHTLCFKIQIFVLKKALKSKINRTGALSLYKEVYTKTLTNIENLLNTDKDNTLAKVLVEETPYLNNRKIINFVRDTEVSSLKI